MHDDAKSRAEAMEARTPEDVTATGELMFNVGDRVRILPEVFQESIGVVTGVIPGRSPVISAEFVVKTTHGSHRFFEDQLILIPDGSVHLDTGRLMA